MQLQIDPLWFGEGRAPRGIRAIESLSAMMDVLCMSLPSIYVDQPLWLGGGNFMGVQDTTTFSQVRLGEETGCLWL